MPADSPLCLLLNTESLKTLLSPTPARLFLGIGGDNQPRAKT